jgi:hypothetical protein
MNGALAFSTHLNPAAAIVQGCRGRRSFRLTAVILGDASMLASQPVTAAYLVDNLVSDLPCVAMHRDANLLNPWGLARSPTMP